MNSVCKQMGKKKIPVIRDHCSAGGFIPLKEVGNCPKHVSRAEQLKWNHGTTGLWRSLGWKQKDGPVYSWTHANTRLLPGFIPPVKQRSGSLPDPGEEVQHRHGFLQIRTGVRWPAADNEGDIRNMMQGNITFVDLILLKTFQKRSVSSPAPVTMASPSGDMACMEDSVSRWRYNSPTLSVQLPIWRHFIELLYRMEKCMKTLRTLTR